jgi:hypothetical protein
MDMDMTAPELYREPDQISPSQQIRIEAARIIFGANQHGTNTKAAVGDVLVLAKAIETGEL